jgi:hypothetical protein
MPPKIERDKKSMGNHKPCRAVRLNVPLAIMMLMGCGTVEAQANSTTTWEKIKAAERAASKLGSPGSAEYDAARANAFNDAIDRSRSYRDSGAIIDPAGKPTITLDPRFNDNLVWMARQTVSGDNSRIFGGVAVLTGDFPDVVAVRGNSRLCTGTLIARDVVLTAGHCVCNGVKTQVTFGNNLNAAKSEDTFDVKASKVMGGCPTAKTARAGEDVALLYLNKPQINVRPRALVVSSTITRLKEVRAVGFGLNEEGETGFKMLVDLPEASQTCAGTRNQVPDEEYYKCKRGAETVAGLEGLNRDTCTGDSGGPIFVKLRSSVYALLGTTSRGVGSPGAAKCGDGGIYELTQGEILIWIRDTNHVPVELVLNREIWG